MIVNYQEYIEQVFCGNLDFGRQVNCLINKNGHGINQLILKIVLPNLPNNIKYKKNPVYDLIKSVQLEIGGKLLFKYTGQQLEKLDIITKNYEKKLKIYNSLKKNSIRKGDILNPLDLDVLPNCDQHMIFYPIDLTEYFGHSILENDDGMNNQPFDLTFKGIRLCDLRFHEVRFWIQLNDIFNIIENQIHETTDQYQELKGLHLVDPIMLVNFTKSDMKMDINNFPQIKQKIKIWNVDDKHNYYFDKPIDKLKLRMCWCPSFGNANFCNAKKIKKIIFQCDQAHKLKKYSCQIDGHDVLDGFVDPNQMNAIYEFNNNVTLDHDTYAFELDSTPKQMMSLLLIFSEPICGLKLTAFFEGETECIYNSGLLKF